MVALVGNDLTLNRGGTCTVGRIHTNNSAARLGETELRVP